MAEKTPDWNKWELVYNWVSEDGREYLSDQEYANFKEALSEGNLTVFLGERALTSKFIVMRRNPNWVDPDQLKQARKIVAEQRAERQKKYGKVFDDDQE